MEIVVLAKQVPDTAVERVLDAATGWIRRDPSLAVLDEISARAVEKALQLREAHGGTVTVLTMGPDKAADALKHALAMGADRGVLISDASLAGADAVQTAQILAAALNGMEFDLIMAGNASTDGRGGIVPAMLAEVLHLPQATSLKSFDIQDGSLAGDRMLEDSIMEIRTGLPAVVSVTEHIANPRHPGLKGIMSARQKETVKLSLANLSATGPSRARNTVHRVEEKPARQGGSRVLDDGTAGQRIADYLIAEGLV
jgi:electron transfer flavoprotein beta subunit